MCETSQHFFETNSAYLLSFPYKLFHLHELWNIMFESQGEGKVEVCKTVSLQNNHKSRMGSIASCCMLPYNVWKFLIIFFHALFRNRFLSLRLGTNMIFLDFASRTDL